MLPSHLHLQRTSTYRPHPQLPHSHDLADFKELNRHLERKMHSKLPSPRNLLLVAWTKGSDSVRHYNTPRARPATMSAHLPLNQNGTPNAVSSALSNFCESMNRVGKQQREIKGFRVTIQFHQSVVMLQRIQGFLRSRVALQPDMEAARTNRRAHRGGRENEAVEGGCCYAGNEADSVGCPEGEAFRGVWEGSYSRVGGEQAGCWKHEGGA